MPKQFGYRWQTERARQLCLYCGKGNNGGDALVVGKWLRAWGWQVEVHLSHPEAEISGLAQKKLLEFEAEIDCESVGDELILIDGLLGIGAKGAIRVALRPLADELNNKRLSQWGTVYSIDIPSGVDVDTGEPYGGAVVADHTLSICAPKRGIVQQDSINHVGRIHEISLSELPINAGDASIRLLSPKWLASGFPRRAFDTHKGHAGRVAIIAGSKGLTGAAELASLGAIHAGAGLVSLYVPDDVYPILAARVAAEVMVQPLARLDGAAKVDVFAIGPGLASEMDESLFEMIVSRPAVVDADAFNWLAERPDWMAKLDSEHVLTPHPGEMRRLAPKLTGDRIKDGKFYAENWGVTLLYKGARTVIAAPGHPLGIASTGTPAMASGGMGDVLTGVIGQGVSSYAAACIGSWVLGRAGELGRPTVTASKVARGLGTALAELRAACRE